MKKQLLPSAFTLPLMMVRLAAASWQTILQRSLMMAQGSCSAAEYQRMVTEKAVAVSLSMKALMIGRSQAAALAPFVSRTRANAKRLGRKG